jgi:hypothetical protein
MPFDPSFIAGVGLLAALSTFFIGLGLAAAVLALLRMGDGRGAGRISLIIVFCSFAIAAGAWVFVLAARSGLGLPVIRWYALAGLLIGLSGGLAPRLVGIPVLTLAILAVVLGSSELAAWHAWQNGLEIMELKIYAADEGSSLCGLSLPDRNAVPVLQNIRLAPGPLVLEVDALAVDGPLAFFLGSRHYRLVSLGIDEVPADGSVATDAHAGRTANGAPAIHVFPARRGILYGDGTGSPIGGFLGMTRTRLRSMPLPAEDLAQGTYVLEPDGGLASILR